MKNELDILREAAQKLHSLKIPYMLTGSLAMSYYATPRMTRDIDIVIELNRFNSESFINVFDKEYYLSKEAVKDSINNEFIFNLIHLDSSIKIDFIIRKDTEYRKTEFNRRKQVAISDFEIFIVSKEDLIISKLEWYRQSGSEMQKRDILNLLNTGFDELYLMNWINELDLKKEFMELRNE